MGRGAERWLRVAMAEPAEEEELPVPGESGDGPLCPLLPAGGGTSFVRCPFWPSPPPSGLPAASAVCSRPLRGGRGNAALRGDAGAASLPSPARSGGAVLSGLFVGLKAWLCVGPMAASLLGAETVKWLVCVL